ncbi:MAG: hypothetical protein J6N72_01885, partial [Psychrobacter sp.]|nr:hypothetical protein [Psychrobacter sp.]
FYAQQIDSIASQVGIDLDQINLSWIRRFLPATAVIIGMRYNSQLIDEVIGVAQATFAPDAKLANRAITDDSKSEAEVSKFSGNEEKQNTEDNASASQSSEDKSADDTDKKADEKGSENKDSKKKDESADAADSKKVSKTDKTADKQKK